ncbi:MAG: class I SAM-dependent methyltransferase [Candidatus Nanohaloarchaeota archaeon QJJ-7]|nr:class I SAM-dependent methyltransferase [Candidatus Nanohaloarchaeota archaeon QJJ-7]
MKTDIGRGRENHQKIYLDSLYNSFMSLRGYLRQYKNHLRPLINSYRRPEGEVYAADKYWEDLWSSADNHTDAESTGISDTQLQYYYRLMEAKILEHLIVQDYDIKGRPVLDIGSGGGQWIQFWNWMESSPVTGIEISESAVQGLKSSFRDDNDIHIREGDIVTADLSESNFGIISAIEVVQHIVDDQRWEKAVANICYTLQSGGIGFVSGWFGKLNHDLWYTPDTPDIDFHTSFSLNRDKAAKRTRSRKQWKQTLEKHGCKIEVIHRIDAAASIFTPPPRLLVFKKSE